VVAVGQARMLLYGTDFHSLTFNYIKAVAVFCCMLLALALWLLTFSIVMALAPRNHVLCKRHASSQNDRLSDWFVL
jgi:hypothetical protein